MDQRYDAAIFDLGDVLIHIDIERTVTAWAEACGLSPEEIQRRFNGEILYHSFERGEISHEEFRIDVCSRLGVEIMPEAFLESWNALLGDPLPGAEELVEGLARQMPLALLTNTNATHTAVWSVTSERVLRHFDRVFTSHDLRARKPEPEAFRPVIDHLGAPPERILYFDDRAENVEAGRDLGLEARQVVGPAEVRHALKELGIDA